MNQTAETRNQSAAELGEIIAEEIHLLRHLFNAQQYRPFRDGSREFLHMDSRLLSHVSRHPGATQSDLVDYFSRDKGQVAKLVGGLRERGLLEVKVDDADRRVQRLYLTAKGREVGAGVQRERQRVVRVAMKGLDASDRRTLIDLLRRVRQNLDQD